MLIINTIFNTLQQFTHFYKVAKIKESTEQSITTVLCILGSSGRMEKYLDLWEDKDEKNKTWDNLVKIFKKAHRALCCYTSTTVSSMENVAKNVIMEVLLEAESKAETQMVSHMDNTAMSQQNLYSKLQEISTALSEV